LHGEQTCVSPDQYICSEEAPFIACSVQQCPLPEKNTLCRVGKHRYYYCSGEKCCTSGNTIASFIQPAELINAQQKDANYWIPRIMQAALILASFIALYTTRDWNYVRTKNLYMQVIDLLAHCLVLRYVLSPQITDSCFIRHLFDGMGTYLTIWNSKIFHVYFRSQVFKLEQYKKKLIFSKLIKIDALIKREKWLEFLSSARVAALLAIVSISFGMSAIHMFSDISIFESSTCINPHTTIGAIGVSYSIGSIFTLAFVTITLNYGLDAYATKWETYAYLMTRVCVSLLTQMIFWVVHMGLNHSSWIVSGGTTYVPYNLQKGVMWGSSTMDILVCVWTPIIAQLVEQFREPKYIKLEKQVLDRDDIFVLSLANYAVREYSVDAILCWKMIRKIQENRETATALYFVDLFLKRVPQFSHVDIRWCLENMNDVNDVLNDEYLNIAEERLRTTYLEPLTERMLRSDEIVLKTMTTTRII
jgi:hypothetical protein